MNVGGDARETAKRAPKRPLDRARYSFERGLHENVTYDNERSDMDHAMCATRDRNVFIECSWSERSGATAVDALRGDRADRGSLPRENLPVPC